MKKVERYARPNSLAEALSLKAKDREAAWLSGGTYILAGDGRDKPASLIDVGAFIPKGIAVEGESVVIGAGATFQELIESRLTPALLAEAASSMRNRNIRDRATIGGNLGANRACSSLIPSLLVMGALVESAIGRSGSAIPLGDWLDSPEGLALSIRVPIDAKRRSACGRWARTACDLSVLTAAVSYDLESDKVAGLRIAMGGLGPRARLFPELETLFEGGRLPARDEIESSAAPLLEPIDDLRGSAAFKRLRAAALLADLLAEARSPEAGK